MDNTKKSSRSSSHRAISQVAISAMMLALALAIKGITKLVPVMTLPNGGSVSIILVPLCLCALLCGAGWGTLIAIAFSVINFLWDGVMSWTTNTSAAVLTIFLDYIVAFGVIGISAIFRKSFFQKKAYAPVLAVLVSGVLRFISHFFSGIIVWNQIWNAEGALTPDWSLSGITYSVVYNGSYMLPTIILSILVMLYLLRPLYSLFSTTMFRALKPASVQDSELDKPVILSYRKLSYFYLGFLAIISVLGTIPQIKMYGIGVITLVLALGTLAYEIYRDIKNKGNLKLVDYLMLAGFILVIGLSIVAIISRFTYGASFYQD